MNSQHLKAILVACGLGASGLAAALPVTFNGFANGSQSVSVNVTPNSPVEGQSVAAGGFSTSYNGQSFVSYCVDLYEYLPRFGTVNNTYNEVSAAGFFGAKLDAVGRLFTGFAGGVDTALESAAFQLALWEIKYETGATYNLSSGSASFTDLAWGNGNAVAIAQTYLAGLSGFANNVQLHVLTSVDGRRIDGKQDVVYATAVPEPSTYALMLAGLAGLGMVARRRQAKR